MFKHWHGLPQQVKRPSPLGPLSDKYCLMYRIFYLREKQVSCFPVRDAKLFGVTCSSMQTEQQ